MTTRRCVHRANYTREGVLVECDPSIKAIIMRIDEQHSHAFIIEDIDDEHVLVKKGKHEELKHLLKDVSCQSLTYACSLAHAAAEIERYRKGGRREL